MTASFDSETAMFQRLEKDPEEPTAPLSGNPRMHYSEIEAGRADAGIWTCTVGAWDEDPQDADEVAYITKGRLRLTPQGGDAFELSAGDLLYLPQGWTGRWEVLEDLSKVYVVMP